MTTAAHAAAGALVGVVLTHPAIAVVGGAASHAVLDVVPHYDLPDWRVDAGLTIALGLFFIGAAVATGQPSVAWGAVGGIVPDVENLVMKLGWIRSEQRVFPTHDGVLPHGRALGRAHGLVQVAIVLAAIIVVARA